MSLQIFPSGHCPQRAQSTASQGYVEHSGGHETQTHPHSAQASRSDHNPGCSGSSSRHPPAPHSKRHTGRQPHTAVHSHRGRWSHIHRSRNTSGHHIAAGMSLLSSQPGKPHLALCFHPRAIRRSRHRTPGNNRSCTCRSSPRRCTEPSRRLHRTRILHCRSGPRSPRDRSPGPRPIHTHRFRKPRRRPDCMCSSPASRSRTRNTRSSCSRHRRMSRRCSRLPTPPQSPTDR